MAKDARDHTHRYLTVGVAGSIADRTRAMASGSGAGILAVLADLLEPRTPVFGMRVASRDLALKGEVVTGSLSIEVFSGRLLMEDLAASSRGWCVGEDDGEAEDPEDGAVTRAVLSLLATSWQEVGLEVELWCADDGCHGDMRPDLEAFPSIGHGF